MLLEVGRATTGRSVLSGRARFTDIFPWGRRARMPGMELDAHWTDVGDVVENLKDAWGLERRMPGRLDGDISAKLQGPFTGLEGRFQAAGPRAQFEVDLDRDLRVDARMRLDGIETDGVLDPALAPLLAGRGHIRGGAVRLDRQDQIHAEAVARETEGEHLAEGVAQAAGCGGGDEVAANAQRRIIGGKREIRQQAVPGSLNGEVVHIQILDRRFQVGSVGQRARDGLFAIDRGGLSGKLDGFRKYDRQIAERRVEIDADLLAQDVFPLRQREFRLRYGELGVRQLLLRVINIEG